MTIQEVSDKYNISLSSLQRNFKRSQESILKKYGIFIIKDGRGDKASYREEIQNDKREETMFKALEPIKTGIIKNDLSMSNFTFNVFMGLITTPMLVFRGTHNDFLRYIDIAISDENIKKLKLALQNLIDDHIIGVMTDVTTEEEVITISLIRAAEKEMKIGIDMIVNCKILSKQYNKKDWIPLLKVWLGTELLSKQEYYTRAELQEMTGLSKYQIDDCGKILKKSNIYKSTRAYAGYKRCLGIQTDMNNKTFYEIK